MADVIRVLEDGDLQTVGLLDYDNPLARRFTAHPKVDPFTSKIMIRSHHKMTCKSVILLV